MHHHVVCSRDGGARRGSDLPERKLRCDDPASWCSRGRLAPPIKERSKMRATHPSPLIGDPRLPLLFWDKVQPTTDGCWIWTASLDEWGYGKYNARKRTLRAHREAYEALVSPITLPEIDHLCRVRCCVNPDHLEPVTGFENYLRGESPARINSKKTVCKSGHGLSGYNLVTRLRRGRIVRECRICNVHAVRRYQARKRVRGLLP